MNHPRVNHDNTLESIETGRNAHEMYNLDSDVKKHLMVDKPDKSTPEKVKSEPVSGLFAGLEDVVYDDEDWKSDDEDDVEDEHHKSNGKGREAPRQKVNVLSKVVHLIQASFKKIWSTINTLSRGHFWSVIFLLGYIAYFVIAMNYEFGEESSWRLLVCTIIGVIVLSRHTIASVVKYLFRCANGGDHLSPRRAAIWKTIKFIFKWTMNIALLGLMLYVLIDEGMDDINNLRSLPGLFAFLLVCLLVSRNPTKIDWYVIYWSMGLQFLLALVALRGSWGREGVLWVQKRFDEFFANSEAGSKLIFGENYKEHYMIFAALPLVFLTNATLVLLYYVGAMQIVTRVIGECLHWVLHTSPVECVSVSGGIFVEGGIMVLILRPYLGSMSKSELFVILTAGLASLGGTYLAILSAFGVSLEFIIPSMLVSAPATFAVCKLIVPENLDSKRKNKGHSVNWDMGNSEKERYSSGLDALQGGAVSIMGLVGNVVAVAFVFFSYISWVNHTLEWFGDRVGIDKLSIELIFSYVLYPVSMAMGVELDDCRRVAMLLGYRIGSTNIIAFFKLAEMKGNKALYTQYMTETNFTGTVSTYRDDITLDLWDKTLTNGFLTDRSEAIVTYCLCGFSSALSTGVLLNFLFVLVPRRRKWLTKMSLAALLAGNVANCMTGCFASIFY